MSSVPAAASNTVTYPKSTPVNYESYQVPLDPKPTDFVNYVGGRYVPFWDLGTSIVMKYTSLRWEDGQCVLSIPSGKCYAYLSGSGFIYIVKFGQNGEPDTLVNTLGIPVAGKKRSFIRGCTADFSRLGNGFRIIGQDNQTMAKWSTRLSSLSSTSGILTGMVPTVSKTMWDNMKLELNDSGSFNLIKDLTFARYLMWTTAENSALSTCIYGTQQGDATWTYQNVSTCGSIPSGSNLDVIIFPNEQLPVYINKMNGVYIPWGVYNNVLAFSGKNYLFTITLKWTEDTGMVYMGQMEDYPSKTNPKLLERVIGAGTFDKYLYNNLVFKNPFDATKLVDARFVIYADANQGASRYNTAGQWALNTYTPSSSSTITATLFGELYSVGMVVTNSIIPLAPGLIKGQIKSSDAGGSAWGMIIIAGNNKDGIAANLSCYFPRTSEFYSKYSFTLEKTIYYKLDTNNWVVAFGLNPDASDLFTWPAYPTGKRTATSYAYINANIIAGSYIACITNPPAPVIWAHIQSSDTINTVTFKKGSAFTYQGTSTIRDTFTNIQTVLNNVDAASLTPNPYFTNT